MRSVLTSVRYCIIFNTPIFILTFFPPFSGSWGWTTVSPHSNNYQSGFSYTSGFLQACLSDSGSSRETRVNNQTIKHKHTSLLKFSSSPCSLKFLKQKKNATCYHCWYNKEVCWFSRMICTSFICTVFREFVRIFCQSMWWISHQQGLRWGTRCPVAPESLLPFATFPKSSGPICCLARSNTFRDLPELWTRQTGHTCLHPLSKVWKCNTIHKCLQYIVVHAEH